MHLHVLFNTTLAESAGSGFCHNNLLAATINVLMDLANDIDAWLVVDVLGMVCVAQRGQCLFMHYTASMYAGMHIPKCVPMMYLDRTSLMRGLF